MSNRFYNWTRPAPAPKPLKVILGAIATLTLAAAALPQLALYFGLSSAGISQNFYWQWFTYFLIEPGPISLSLLLQLGLTLYLGWIFGTSLLDRLGYSKLSGLFFGAVLAGGLGAWGAQELLHLPTLFSGPTAPLYGLLLAWTLLNPQTEILLFFAIPLKARTALFVLIGSTLFIDLTNGQWIHLASVSFSMTYSLIFTRAAFQTFTWGRKRVLSPKVYDIASGQPVQNDDEFMDSMLARISQHGEDSLTPSERMRMTQISYRKSFKK
ncbi:MAG: rhomboid family intramembrane serine protease [Verrucomicrobia bacterium]|nr:rhomboid family intramembrane serine protease [Verrucomicrobiota bacterium]